MKRLQLLPFDLLLFTVATGTHIASKTIAEEAASNIEERT